MMYFLPILQNFSPMGCLALCLIVLLIAVRNGRKIQSIGDNHLHEIAESLREIKENQLKILDCMKEQAVDHAVILTKLNGKQKH